MPELRVAETQQAFLEYRASFYEPIFAYWFERQQGAIVAVMHKALSRWQVGPENVTWNQTPKNAAEIQLNFVVPSLHATIQVGIGGVVMTALNPDWSRAPELTSLFQTGLDALRNSTGLKVRSQQLTLGIHVQESGGRPFKEIMGEFVDSAKLGVVDATMYGVSIYAKDYLFVIDNSAVVAGGVFVKLLRNFPSETTFHDMAASLYRDEQGVLRLLGLKIQ